eukprot:s482_g15.t1
MLNEYLGTQASGEMRPSSHSLKATTLVWAARYGLDDKVRSILGHHSLKENSMACYSRDLLAKPLRDLCGMLHNIKEGRFMPDGTRSGWMSSAQVDLRLDRAKDRRPEDKMDTEVKSMVDSASIVDEGDFQEGSGFDPANPFNEVPIEQEWELPQAEEPPTPRDDEDRPDGGEEFVGSASSDGGSETAELESDLDEESFLKSQQVLHGGGIAKAVEGNLMQNKRSKMLHKRNEDPHNRLQPITQCGLHGESFSCLPDGSTFEWPKCSKCFRGEANASKELVDVVNAGKRRRL